MREVPKYDYHMRFIDSPRTKTLKMLAKMAMKENKSAGLNRAMSHIDMTIDEDKVTGKKWHPIDWLDEVVKHRCERDEMERQYCKH